MFPGKLHERLALGKYTRWAADLTEDELTAVLWAVGEFGVRAQAVNECIDRHTGEFLPGHGLPRARLALGQLARMVAGERIGLDALADEVRVVLARWRGQTDELPK